jgi:hypothetical protein
MSDAGALLIGLVTFGAVAFLIIFMFYDVWYTEGNPAIDKKDNRPLVVLFLFILGTLMTGAMILLYSAV